MITNVDKSYSTFEQNWTRYAEAISQYSLTAPAKTNEMKLALKCLHDDDDDDDGDGNDEMFNPLRTVVAYMRHGKMEFDTCKQITITSSSLA